MIKLEQVSIGAHRGWRNGGHPENSWPAIKQGAERADFVEVDLRPCLDGNVVWHNPTVRCQYGIFPHRISHLSRTNLKRLVAERNQTPLVEGFELARHYPWQLGKPLLLDLKFSCLPENVIRLLRRFPALCCFGVRTIAVLEQCRTITEDPGRIVALPKFPQEIDVFIEAGAGVVRLWQHGATRRNIDFLRQRDVQSLVMLGNRFFPGAASGERLTEVLAARPDFVLMDNPELGQFWRRFV